MNEIREVVQMGYISSINILPASFLSVVELFT